MIDLMFTIKKSKNITIVENAFIYPLLLNAFYLWI